MTETQIEFRKKREIGDIFADSFKFLRLEIKPIAKLIGIYVLPFIILYSVAQVSVLKNILINTNLKDAQNLIENLRPLFLNIFLLFLFNSFVQALLISTFYTYIEAYIKKGKGNFELSEITPNLFNNGLLAIGASVIISIMVIFGIVLFIIPSIYFANTFSPVIIILLFERKGIAAAFARSAFLVNRQWWNTLLVNIVGVIILWLIGFVISIPNILVDFSISTKGQITNPANYPEWYWVLKGFSTVVGTVLNIVMYTFIAFQYFNLDETTKQNEPFGLT